MIDASRSTPRPAPDPSRAAAGLILAVLRQTQAPMSEESDRQGAAGLAGPSVGQARAAWQAYRQAAQRMGPIFEPDLSRPESPCLTKHERRLLRAVAVARAADPALLDNYTYRLALNRGLRARLTEAISLLAAMIEHFEKALPDPSESGSRP